MSFSTHLLNPAAGLAASLTSLQVENLVFAAAFCTTAAFAPLRLRSAREISLPAVMLFSVSVVQWFVHGVHERSKTTVASNGIALLQPVTVLVLKPRYDRRALEGLKP